VIEAFRARRLRVYRRLGRPIGMAVDGFRLVLDPHDELAGLLYVGEYEPEERGLVRRLLRSGDVFVDAGAHVGLYTVLAARAGARVHAIEPSSRSFELLCGNVRRNGVSALVRAHHLALSDEDGEAAIQLGDARFSAWTSFGRVPPGEQRGSERVETRTVDGLIADGTLSLPFLLKLDVEGWELHVLRGGGGTFGAADAPHLLVEFTDVAAEAAGSSTRELYEELSRLGYGLFRYDGGSFVPEPLRDAYPYDNLVATKRLEELRSRLQ
jgi:FkbM family methyltransferase